MRAKLQAAVAAVDGGVPRVRISDIMADPGPARAARWSRQREISHDYFGMLRHRRDSSANYKRAPIELVDGDGVYLVDADGRRYLDFVSGIAVNALGYGDAGLARRRCAPPRTASMHVSNLYATAPGERLAAIARRALVRRQGVLLQLRRGSERGRVQVRAPLGARRRGMRSTRSSRCAARFTAACSARSRRPTGRRIAFRSGRSRPASRSSSATSRTSRWRSTRRRPRALILEPVQGEGGVRVLDAGFVREVRALTRERDVALIFDEIQCGLGRTGTLFAYEHSASSRTAHAREADRRRAADGRDADDRRDRVERSSRAITARRSAAVRSSRRRELRLRAAVRSGAARARDGQRRVARRGA